MSRIGKQPIVIPVGTTVTALSGMVVVKGPHGELSRHVDPRIRVEAKDGLVKLEPTKKGEGLGALWGTYASHVKNMIAGVNKPFEKKLIIEGIGYKAAIQGGKLVLNIGFSHPVELLVPEGITVSADKDSITISGSDKERVGLFASVVRAKKKPEPYKGKGIRYEDETIRRKQGKKVVSTT